MSTIEDLTREQWLERAAAHYVKRAAVAPEIAQQMAEACYMERVPGDPPEDVVDEDLACWEHDGDDE